MRNKPPFSKWADVIPTDTVVIICGLGAITVLFQNLVIACVVGIGEIAIGILVRDKNLEDLFISI
jgi:hypothetical protein